MVLLVIILAACSFTTFCFSDDAVTVLLCATYCCPSAVLFVVVLRALVTAIYRDEVVALRLFPVMLVSGDFFVLACRGVVMVADGF